MRYTPYEHEYQSSDSFSDTQQLEYFLTRVFETEEVWGLDDGCEWIFRTSASGENSLVVWPYKKFAEEAAVDAWSAYHVEAESLESFMEITLEMLMTEDVMVEIMAKPDKPGCLISPHQLKSILTGMIDAGEYRLDG